jgi:hypothetical protein
MQQLLSCHIPVTTLKMLLVSYFFYISLVNTDGVGSHLVTPKLRGPQRIV